MNKSRNAALSAISNLKRKALLISALGIACTVGCAGMDDGSERQYSSGDDGEATPHASADTVQQADIPKPDDSLGSDGDADTSNPEDLDSFEDEGIGVVSTAASGSLTAAQINKAIGWFVKKNGSSGYEGYCEKAVETAFLDHTGVFASAKAAYECARKKGLLHATSKAAEARSIPRGATLFYKTSSNYHVAVFEGYYQKKGELSPRGWLRSTSVRGKIGQTTYPYFQNPLGWAMLDWPHLTSKCN